MPGKTAVISSWLWEAYRSPLAMGYHDNQPWNENMLRPCPVLDNPGRLTEVVEKNRARSTDHQNLETAGHIIPVWDWCGDYFPKYPAISFILSVWTTWKGHLRSQCPQEIQSEAFFSSFS